MSHKNIFLYENNYKYNVIFRPEHIYVLGTRQGGHMDVIERIDYDNIFEGKHTKKISVDLLKIIKRYVDQKAFW